jgi:hypothetical protein
MTPPSPVPAGTEREVVWGVRYAGGDVRACYDEQEALQMVREFDVAEAVVCGLVQWVAPAAVVSSSPATPAETGPCVCPSYPRSPAHCIECWHGFPSLPPPSPATPAENDEATVDALENALVEYDERGELFGTSGAGAYFLASFLVKRGWTCAPPPATPEHNHGAHSVKAMGCPACDAYYRAPSPATPALNVKCGHCFHDKHYHAWDDGRRTGCDVPDCHCSMFEAEDETWARDQCDYARLKAAGAIYEHDGNAEARRAHPIPGEQPGGQER